MNFAANLQFLRKQQNLTQEQLAEQLQVSRQAVTKWETGQSFPDLDRVNEICQFFGCDLNTLVQGTVTASIEEEKSNYEAYCFRNALAITGGVTTVLFGVTLFLFMALFGLEEIGLLVLLVMVTAAVFLFVYFGIEMDHYKKEHPVIPEYYSEQDRAVFRKQFAIALAGGIATIMMGVILCVALAMFGFDNNLPAAVLMLCVTIGTGLLVFFGMQHDRMETSGKTETDPKDDDPVSGAIMMLATAIFLIAGFAFDLWHPAWVVFPIGGILCGVVSSFRKK